MDTRIASEDALRLLKLENMRLHQANAALNQRVSTLVNENLAQSAQIRALRSNATPATETLRKRKR